MPARRRYTRRQFLGSTGKLGIVAAALAGRPLRATAGRSAVFSDGEIRTLNAALARMIPSDDPDDWSGADAGAARYIERLLAGTSHLYAGGPYRRHFRSFRRPWRAKRVGWARELRRLRRLYRDGLADLDRRAGGDFASAPDPAQDAILAAIDLEGSPFFAALYDHTMEGTYAHPVYGGNRDYVAWKTFGYEGDVHGVRFPERGSRGDWNEYGGYSPEEMAEPGEGP